MDKEGGRLGRPHLSVPWGGWVSVDTDLGIGVVFISGKPGAKSPHGYLSSYQARVYVWYGALPRGR